MMKRLSIVIAAALLLAGAFYASKANAQASSKLCFPTVGTSGNALAGPNCQDVTISNPLPTLNPIGTNVIGIVSINQSTPGPTGTNAVTIGDSLLALVSPTVATTTSYVANNCIGGFNAITVGNYNGQSGFVSNAILTDVQNLTGTGATITAYLFNQNPSQSTCTDKSTFTLAGNDLSKLVTAPFNIQIVAPTGTNSVSVGGANFPIKQPFKLLANARTLFVALVASTAFSAPNTTTAVNFTLGIELN